MRKSENSKTGYKEYQNKIIFSKMKILVGKDGKSMERWEGYEKGL